MGVTYTGTLAAQSELEPDAAAIDEARELSELSLEELLDMPVVTASGRAEERSLAAANVFVVTREEIRRRGYRSLADILRRVPGMYLVYDYVTYSVGVREVTGGYRGGTRIVKVMIDGVPISFRPDSQAFIGPEFIPMEAIERVEVAKGPLSALYGANAFLATVNVITRKAEQRGVEAAAETMVVNHNPGFGTSAVATYAGGKNRILLSVDAERVDRSGLTIKRTYDFQDLRDPTLAEASKDDIARPLSAFARFDHETEGAGTFQLNPAIRS